MEVVCASISLTILKQQCTQSAGLRAGSRGVSSGQSRLPTPLTGRPLYSEAEGSAGWLRQLRSERVRFDFRWFCPVDGT